MKLYLLRHGDSEGRAATDAQRQLTAAGQQEVLEVAAQFARKGITLDRCFSSPFLRADQTAELFLSNLPDAPTIEYDPILTPEKRAFEVMAFLEKHMESRHVLLVSHNPLVSELNAMLVEGNINDMMILGTGDLVAIDVDVMADGLGRREFYLVPVGSD